MNYSPIKAIEQHVLKKRGKLNAPLSLFLELTNVCNQECFFCVQPGNWQKKIFKQSHMAMEYLERTLFAAKEFGVLELFISGGEPTCHPRFLDIISLVKKLQLRTSIYTNGVNFSAADVKMLSNILEPGWDCMLLGLDAADKVTYRKLRGKDHFDSVLKTLERFRDEAMPFVTQMVILRSNIEYLEDTWKLSSEYGAKAHKLILPYRKKELSENIYTSNEEISLALKRLSNQKVIHGEKRTSLIFHDDQGSHHSLGHVLGKIRKETNHLCSFGITSFAMSANGDFHACPFALDCGLSLGNLQRTSLSDGWRKIRLLMEKPGTVNLEHQTHNCIVLNNN